MDEEIDFKISKMIRESLIDAGWLPPEETKELKEEKTEFEFLLKEIDNSLVYSARDSVANAIKNKIQKKLNYN